MALGSKASERQHPLFVAGSALAKSPGHPFYDRLNRLLGEAAFDRFVEDRCRSFYAETMGRPGTPPGVYFRMLMVGYFEGISSERGIAWRCADSLALRSFLGYGLDEVPPDHSTLSRTRRLIDLEAHRDVFTHLLALLAEHGLVTGQTVAIDATTLEANAALRSIVRRDTGESYDSFLDGLAKESGIATPTREDRAKLDKKRKGKGKNDDWTHPHDPDAKITKMKDGRTHLAHKLEQATDLDSTAIVGVTVQPADRGDTQSVGETLLEAAEQLREVLPDEDVIAEGVLDKGYHSNGVVTDLAAVNVRSYVSEPKRGRRRWTGKHVERNAVYANRRRIRGERGKALQRRRAEVAERSFAHLLETGGLRRMHVRRQRNVLKRILIGAASYNLGLLMRTLTGAGTPRSLQGRLAALCRALWGACRALISILGRISSTPIRRGAIASPRHPQAAAA
jgi:transposase